MNLYKFDKMRGIPWLAEELLAFQEGPSPVSAVRKLVMLLAGYRNGTFYQAMVTGVLCLEDVGFPYPEPAMGLYGVRFEASNFRIGSIDMPINSGMMISGGKIRRLGEKPAGVYCLSLAFRRLL